MLRGVAERRGEARMAYICFEIPSYGLVTHKTRRKTHIILVINSNNL